MYVARPLCTERDCRSQCFAVQANVERLVSSRIEVAVKEAELAAKRQHEEHMRRHTEHFDSVKEELDVTTELQKEHEAHVKVCTVSRELYAPRVCDVRAPCNPGP